MLFCAELNAQSTKRYYECKKWRRNTNKAITKVPVDKCRRLLHDMISLSQMLARYHSYELVLLSLHVDSIIYPTSKLCVLATSVCCKGLCSLRTLKTYWAKY